MTSPSRAVVRRLFIPLVGLVLLEASAALAAKAPKPEPCPEARYLVGGAAIVSNVTGETMPGLVIGGRCRSTTRAAR